MKIALFLSTTSKSTANRTHIKENLRKNFTFVFGCCIILSSLFEVSSLYSFQTSVSADALELWDPWKISCNYFSFSIINSILGMPDSFSERSEITGLIYLLLSFFSPNFLFFWQLEPETWDAFLQLFFKLYKWKNKKQKRFSPINSLHFNLFL